MSTLLDRPLTDDPALAPPDAPSEPPPPGTVARTAALLAVIAAALALGWSVLVGSGDGLPRGAVAVVLSGAIERADGASWRTVAPGGELSADTRVRAVGGEAALEVDGGELRLASGTQVILGAGTARLERGSVVSSGDARRVRVDAVTVAGEGTWRVDEGRQPRVAVYEGAVSVDDGANTVDVPRLRQVTVRDGVVAANGVRPLRYLVTDPFDAALLAEAFRVDDLATSLLRSLASAHGTAPRGPAFYRAFVSVEGAVEARLREAAPEVEDERFGPPADVLLTAVLIDAVVEETDRSPATVTDAVVALRRDGATWGLIALDTGIDGAALSAAADRALQRAEDDPPPDPPSPAPSPTDDASPGTAPGAPTPAPGGTAGAPSPSSPAPPPSSPPSPSPGDDDAPETDDGGVLRPVEDLLRDGGSAVGGLVEDTGDALGDVVGGVDELLSPSGGLLGR